ncbi:MAG TPA: hypothetical protein VGM15_07395 [Burkholderiaceae bacterium]
MLDRASLIDGNNSMADQAGAVRGIGQAVLDTFTRAAAGSDRLVPELVSILAAGIKGG